MKNLTGTSRSLCGCCGKKGYQATMDKTPIPNRNNAYTYFCKNHKCTPVMLDRLADYRDKCQAEVFLAQTIVDDVSHYRNNPYGRQFVTF